jgi:SdrD B-like protein
MISSLVETIAHTQIRKTGFGLTSALLSTMLLAPLALIWGCAGLVSSQTSQQTFSISGTISPAAGGNGTTVTLSGATAATTTADSSRNYTFTGLANGTYAVTPSHTGYTFSPTSQSAMVKEANVTGLNFSATVQLAHSVALVWNASTSVVSFYNVYRSAMSGTAYTKISSTLGTVLSYTDTAVLNGTTYYYVTTAVDASGAESVYSNQVSAVIP